MLIYFCSCQNCKQYASRSDSLSSLIRAHSVCLLDKKNGGPRSAVGKGLATDACLTADPGVASSIPVRSHTVVEIDHEMISTVILLPSANSFKKGYCQLQAKVCARITG